MRLIIMTMMMTMIRMSMRTIKIVVANTMNLLIVTSSSMRRMRRFMKDEEIHDDAYAQVNCFFFYHVCFRMRGMRRPMTMRRRR